MALTARDLLNQIHDATTNAIQVVLTAGTASIGKLAANSGVDIGDVDVTSIAAGDNNIGNVDIASALPAGTNAIGKLAANSGVDIGDTDSRDLGPSWTTVMGLTNQARFTSADQSSAAADVTAAPTAGQKLVITDIVVSVDTAMRVDFKEETAGTVFLSAYLPANSGAQQITPRGKFKLNTADKKLQVQTSVAGNIAAQIWYYSEA